MAEIDDVLSELKKRAAKILELDANSFARITELGEVNLQPAVPVIQHYQDILRSLVTLDLTRVPLERLKQLRDEFGGFDNTLGSVRNFKIGNQGGNLPGERNTHLTNVNAGLLRLYELAGPVLAINKGDHRAAATSVEAAKAAAAEVTAFKEKAEAALKQIQNAAAQAGASKEAIHFEKEAHHHKAAARWWLGFSILLTVVVIGLTGWFYLYPLPVHPDAKWEVVQRIGAKLILLSMLSFLLVFAVRNYSTSRHNFIINRHRAVALTTFENFVKGTSDETTKNAILEAAAKSVFSPQISGYLRKSDGGFPVLDWLKFATGGK